MEDLELEQYMGATMVIQMYTSRKGTVVNKIEDFKAHDREREIILIKDWKGRIGNDINMIIGCMGKYGTRISIKPERKRVLKFYITNDMKIGNTFYGKSSILWNKEIETKVDDKKKTGKTYKRTKNSEDKLTSRLKKLSQIKNKKKPKT